jgi:hypothetical protein
MKLHKPLSLLIQVIVTVPLLLGTAQARSNACEDLAHPLHTQVNGVKDRGGMWSRYEKSRQLTKHSALALKVDSKVVALMFTLNYLCDTLEGIPYNDVAEYIVPQVKEIGEEGFIKKHVDLGHSMKDVTDWVNYGRFSVKHLNRRLDMGQIRKTIEQIKVPIEHYVQLFQKIKAPVAVIADTKALIADIEKLQETDPYLKQADHENGQVPYSSILSNSGDAM